MHKEACVYISSPHYCTRIGENDAWSSYTARLTINLEDFPRAGQISLFIFDSCKIFHYLFTNLFTQSSTDEQLCYCQLFSIYKQC